jgi:bifunctional lysine-specific demethylase and histidyl-hydroxylase NO66
VVIQSALERCVGDATRFAERHWGRRPLHRAGGDSEGFDDLLSLAHVDHLVSSAGLRLPAFRLVKGGATVPSSRYTRQARTGSQPVTGLADPAGVYREFEGGATIVLQGLHRYWRPLSEFCRRLEMDMGHPVQVNAYITPPGSQGLAVHRDDHDVFVLHVFGSKAWQVFDAPDGRGEGEPLFDGELRRGDSLYIPRGFPHAASTQETASAHLTVGILAYRWSEVLREAVKAAEEEAEFAEPLPLRFADDPEAFRASVEDRLQSLQAAVEKVDAAGVAGRLRRRFLTGRQPLLTGQLQQILALPGLSQDSTVRRRPGAICDIAPVDGELSVLLGDRELRMPAWVEPAMRAVAAMEQLTVRELEPYLEEGSGLVLVRRLVREGLLEVVD